MFITFIGLKNANIVIADPATLVALGDLSKGDTLLAVFGVVITVILMVRKVNGAVFIGMVITAIVGMLFQFN